ncbi:MAG: hypothetical protein ACKV2U_15520 [Bryobacteraceae bacterium]
MTKEAKIYISAVVAPGVAALVWAGIHWNCPNLGAFAVYLAVALILGVTRLKLPGLEGTYSLSFLPVLYGLNHFTASEVLVVAALSAVAGCLVRPKRKPSVSQVLFNSANLTLSAGSCLLVYGFLADRIPYLPATLCVMVALYFAFNTLLVSGILTLVQGKSLSSVCEAWYLWSFVYYLAGAALMGLAMSSSQEIQAWIILLPIAYLIWFFRRIRSKPIETQGAAGSTRIPMKAQLYIQAVAVAGGILLVAGSATWASLDSVRFAACVAAAALASGCKVRLPGMVGTISTSFVVILFAASELQWGETMALAAVAAVVQSYWKARRRPLPTQVIFNVATVVLSSTAAYAACHSVAELSLWNAALLPSLLVSTAVYYGCNTALVCIVLGLIEHKSLSSIWTNCRFWSLPYYLVGTAATGIMVAVSRSAGYHAAFLVLTVMALVFLAYRVQLKAACLSSSPAAS